MKRIYLILLFIAPLFIKAQTGCSDPAADNYYCDEVQDWFNSPNPYERAYNPDDIDEAFYEEVCNRKLRNKSNDINTKILIYGSIVTIILTTVTFIVLHNLL